MSADALLDITTDPRGRSLGFEGLAGFLAEPGCGVAFVAGEPGRRPESQDVAVVLRELLRDPMLRVRVGVVEGALTDDVKERFDLRIEPTLVLVRDGEIRTVLPGIKDWAVYRDSFRNLLRGDA